MKYFYLRDKQNFPVACIVTDFLGGSFRAAISNYNPADRFNKTIARNYARQYLHFGRTIVEYDGFTLTKPRKASFTVGHVSAHLTPKEFVLACIIHTPRGKELASSAARQAAKRWLKEHGCEHVAWTQKQPRSKWYKRIRKILRAIGVEWR